jgi:hypothetical protein
LRFHPQARPRAIRELDAGQSAGGRFAQKADIPKGTDPTKHTASLANQGPLIH